MVYSDEKPFRLEDLTNRSQIVKQYYSWLLDDSNISLEKELDVSLGISHKDPFIYYPNCIADLFHTECLQKLGRISQLSSIFQSNPGAWHSRLEHSIAAFNKKQEEHIYLWMTNPDFVKHVEENGLKKFLLAEEIKILYHDVGHLPFSHVTEKEILGSKGIHEKIGMNILLTDPEVVAILTRLGIYDEVKTVLTEDILNSAEHDDGNADVDRKAFQQTDIAHLGGIENPNRYPIYFRKIAKINPDGSYMRAKDGSIILADSLDQNSKYIDVYTHSDISEVEKILSTRESLYTNHYYHPKTLAHDTIIGLVQSKIATENPEYCQDLITYIDLLKKGDFKAAKKYDEVDIFKSLISLGLNSKDPNVVDMVSLLFVPFSNWLNLMNSQLDKDKDAEFIKSIKKDLIQGSTRFAQNLRRKDFFEKNVLIVQSDNSTSLQNQGLEHLIYNSHSLRAYNSSQPIYVEDADGKVLPLENHPDRSRDWKNSSTKIDIAICILPLLRLKGLSPPEISSYSAICNQLKVSSPGVAPMDKKVFSYYFGAAPRIAKVFPDGSQQDEFEH